MGPIMSKKKSSRKSLRRSSTRSSADASASASSDASASASSDTLANASLDALESMSSDASASGSLDTLASASSDASASASSDASASAVASASGDACASPMAGPSSPRPGGRRRSLLGLSFLKRSSFTRFETPQPTTFTAGGDDGAYETYADFFAALERFLENGTALDNLVGPSSVNARALIVNSGCYRSALIVVHTSLYDFANPWNHAHWRELVQSKKDRAALTCHLNELLNLLRQGEASQRAADDFDTDDMTAEEIDVVTTAITEMGDARRHLESGLKILSSVLNAGAPRDRLVQYILEGDKKYGCHGDRTVVQPAKRSKSERRAKPERRRVTIGHDTVRIFTKESYEDESQEESDEDMEEESEDEEDMDVSD